MLKSLVVLSLLAIASASTSHSLSEITGFAGTVTVTAAYPDAGVTPVLTAITYTTTYDSSATSLALFTVTGAGTYTGNNTVAQGSLILTNGADTVYVNFDATTTSATAFTLSNGVGQYVKFLNTGNYAVAVTLGTAIGSNYGVTLSTAFTAVAATAYVPPTISAFNLVTPQTGGCDATSCVDNVNGTITLTPGRVGSQWTTFLRSTHASTGVLFGTSATLTNGAADFNQDTYSSIAAMVGGISRGIWSAKSTTLNTVTRVPQNDNLVISGQLYEASNRYTWFSEATVGAKQASVQLTSGSTDVTAPTCTVAAITPATITTVDQYVQATATIACADETGGSGLSANGFFITATATNGNGGTISFPTGPVSLGTFTQYIPPYVSGSFQIVGLWAVDNAGNAALYGSCGGAVGYDSLGCAGGGGSSSASTVAFSLFSVLLAVLVLFA